MSRARDTANQINRVNSSAADATAITVDSSENVGIGTTPSEKLDVSGNIRALGANSRVLFGPDGFEAGIKYASDASLQIASRTNENITFTNGNDGAERIRIDSDGLKFNGDTAAANALSDYEEGSWTPSMSGMGTATFSQQFGSYTKIGDLVHASGKIAWTSANGSAQVSITGLPFTAADASDHLLRNSAWPQGDYRNIPNLIQKNGHFRVDGNTLFGVIDNTNGYTAGMTRSQLDTFGEFNFYLVYRST